MSKTRARTGRASHGSGDRRTEIALETFGVEFVSTDCTAHGYALVCNRDRQRHFGKQ